MNGLLLVELLFISLLVIVAVIARWRGRARDGDHDRSPPRDGEEPTVLSVDLSDRDP